MSKYSSRGAALDRDIHHILYVSLTLGLAGFWLVLSGHYTWLTLTAGVVSVLGTVALARRMGLIDPEGHPVHLLPRAVTYLPWLVAEIMKSAWAVTKLIVNPKLPISPTLVRVRASQKTPVGITVYANSITLTPGTISARVNGNEILVHAIARDGAEDLAEGTMDRRVSTFEGSQ